MRLILLGAPGAGKGTQAETLSQRLSIPVISTGGILREAIAAESDLGRQAAVFMDKGELVPDDLIVGILKNRLAQDDCLDGFILDGVPRTLEQAKAIEEMGIQIDRVLSLEVPDESIIERIAGRRVCPACGASYHICYKAPQSEGVCDKCGGLLVTRKDDQAETVVSRLRVYHESTEQLKDFYSRAGKLREVIGREEIADTTRATLASLEV